MESIDELRHRLTSVNCRIDGSHDSVVLRTGYRTLGGGDARPEDKVLS